MATDESPQPEQSNAEQDASQDEAGAGKDRAFREWMMIAVGLTGLMSVLAIILALIALASPSTQTTVLPAASASARSMMGTAAQASSAAAPAVKPEAVKLTIKSDDEHGKRGPDGKWHDAFLPANFAVHAGAQVTVTVTNYDQSAHTFTSSTLSNTSVIDEQIAAGTDSGPRTTTFTFTAPTTPGKYLWWCAMPCDPFAMAHIGYMRGFVTVSA